MTPEILPKGRSEKVEGRSFRTSYFILLPSSFLQPSGDLRSLAPPVPIPNTEVKRAFADGSASIGCARVGRCQYYEPRGRKLLRGSFFVRHAVVSFAILIPRCLHAHSSNQNKGAYERDKIICLLVVNPRKRQTGRENNGTLGCIDTR
jgi:hypothetical protein